MPASYFFALYIRLRAAFLADRRKPDEPLVRIALRAAAFRAPAPRLRATALACRDRAAGEAAERGSRFNALDTARERFLDGLACFVLAAPCFPSRMWCISSRTNSPAGVLGDLPSSSSRLARSITSCSGTGHSLINLNWVHC